jgi:RNA polymerase sigma-70 factor, ECF subfamily
MSIQNLDTDSLLLSSAIGGDAQALERLIYRHHKKLASFVERLFPQKLYEWIEPADILQETYTAAFCSIGAFEPKGEDAFFRWLATIARTRIVDQIKAASRFKRQGERLDDHDLALSDVLQRAGLYKRTPSQSAAGHELVALVERSMEQLPQEQREIIRLRHEEGLSPPQAAERMQRRVGAAQMVYFRALKNLREKIRAASLYL